MIPLNFTNLPFPSPSLVWWGWPGSTLPPHGVHYYRPQRGQIPRIRGDRGQSWRRKLLLANVLPWLLYAWDTLMIATWEQGGAHTTWIFSSFINFLKKTWNYFAIWFQTRNFVVVRMFMFDVFPTSINLSPSDSPRLPPGILILLGCLYLYSIVSKFPPSRLLGVNCLKHSYTRFFNQSHCTNRLQQWLGVFSCSFPCLLFM